jgi:metal-responsive CopG/Arc/MetJ family transcriptional regulator
MKKPSEIQLSRSISIPIELWEQADVRAKQLEVNRSQYFRCLLEADLANANQQTNEGE